MAASDDPPFDLEPLSGSAHDPARDSHARRRSRSSGCRTIELRASYFVGVLPQTARLPRHSGQPARIGDLRREELQEPADVPVPVDIVNVFRAPDALPAIAAEAVAIGAKNLWCQFSVINEEGGRIAEAGGAVRRHGSLHQGRACPLHGPDALARLQHAAHHVRARRPSVALVEPAATRE